METAIPNPRVETSKVGLKIAVSTHSIATSNQIFIRAAMKYNMHYSKQNSTESTSVNAALASLGQQTSHSLQSLRIGRAANQYSELSVHCVIVPLRVSTTLSLCIFQTNRMLNVKLLCE